MPRVKHADPFYNSQEWEAVRHLALKRDRYYCQTCGALCLGKKRGKPNPHVDHVIPRKEKPEWALKLANLQVLCHSCHSRKSILDTMAKEKPMIGLDGYPC